MISVADFGRSVTCGIEAISLFGAELTRELTRMVADALAYDTCRNRERLARQILMEFLHHRNPNRKSIFGTRMSCT